MTRIVRGWMALGLVVACGRTTGPPQLDSAAVAQCQAFLRKELRAPDAATFPASGHKVIPVGDGSKQVYRIESHVDAQNTAGATVRSNYTCTARFHGGDASDARNWELVDLAVAAR